MGDWGPLGEWELKNEIRKNIRKRDRENPQPKIVTDLEYHELEKAGADLRKFTRLSDFYERNEKHFKRFNARKAAWELRNGIGTGAYRANSAESFGESSDGGNKGA